MYLADDGLRRLPHFPRPVQPVAPPPDLCGLFLASSSCPEWPDYKCPFSSLSAQHTADGAGPRIACGLVLLLSSAP